MAEGKRRRHLSEDVIEESAIPSDDEDLPRSKKAKKDDNISARRTLFVRSLPATVTNNDLTELFSESYPLKHAVVVLDKETKQSKGYGFVTFADADDAQRAKEELNGHVLQGRKMKLDIAEPRKRHAGEEGKPANPAGAEAKAKLDKQAAKPQPPKLIIRNLPWDVKEPDDLSKLFQRFGKVKHATLPKSGKGVLAGFGFVVMRGRKNAERALAEVNGTEINGRTVAVDWAVDKEVWEAHKNDEQAEEVQEDKPSEVAAEKESKYDGDDYDVDADVANFMKSTLENLESEDESDGGVEVNEMASESEDDDDDAAAEESETASEPDDVEERKKSFITDNSTTLFVRNLPFTSTDESLKEHFSQFGPVRYARVVMNHVTERSRGTGFVCFFNIEDVNNCLRNAPKHQPTAQMSGDIASRVKHSVLQDEDADPTGAYTMEGRILQLARAVGKEQATKLTEAGITRRDNDKRRLFLLSEGTVPKGSALYNLLSPTEVKMREDSAKQRQKLVKSNPTLHLSLTRLSVRNIPRHLTSKDLKQLARQAVVGFASDVKSGRRVALSKDEEARGGEELREAEKARRAKGKGVVKQAKIVFESRDGTKITETGGGGRSRGYGFIEYFSHRWALMGLRWLNGYAVENPHTGKKQRLIVEFSIDNRQVVERRRDRENKARIRSKEEKAQTAVKEDGDVDDAGGGAKNKDKSKSGSTKTGKGKDDKDLTEEQARLARRQQIINKKRAMRRARRKGGA